MSSASGAGDLGVSVTPEAVLRELETILASSGFINSRQISKFLRYTVEQTLQGNADRLKEYQLGIDVFGRLPSYDTRTDPVVRVQARQLRFKLADYYAGPGARDEIAITLPKGGYMAHFELRTIEPEANNPTPQTAVPESDLVPATEAEHAAPEPAIKPPRRTWIWWTLAALIVCVSLAGTVLFKHGYKTDAVDPEARELYLRGRYYWNRRTADDLNRSIDLYTQAVVKDPAFAQAYVGLADAYNLLSEFGTMPYKDAFGRALAAAKRAVQLDDGSAEAHSALAFAAFYGAFDARMAEREFQRAIQLNPSYATAHHWYATFLMSRGRAAEALKQINEAQTLEPGSDSIVADKDLILANTGQVDQSIRLLKQLESSEPAFESPHWYLSRLYMERRDYADCLSELHLAGSVTKDAEVSALADAGSDGFAKGGERGMLQAMLATEQRQQHAAGHLHFYDMASFCALLGDKEQAIDYLGKSFKEREPAILGIANDPNFIQLHSDPRFRKLSASLTG